MKIVLVAGVVLAVLGAGGLTGDLLSAGPERPTVADDGSRDTSDTADDRSTKAKQDKTKKAKKGKESKESRHEAQRAFVAAKREWTACVGGAAPAHRPGGGPFDPEDACGPKPHPHDDRAPAGAGEHGHGKPSAVGS